MKKTLGLGAFICAAVLMTGPATAADEVPQTAPAEVSIIDLGGGKFTLQNDFGKPFYVYDHDEPNKSNCGEPCSDTWIPVYARRAANDLGGVWSFATRPDGSKQWAYKKQPLYNFGYGDHEPPTEKDLKGWKALKP